MANFGTMTGSIYADGVFKSSFGNLSPEATYAGGVETYNYDAKTFRDDFRKELAQSTQKIALLRKERMTSTDEYASGTNYSTTSGNLATLIPIYVDTNIIDMVRKETPLYEMLVKRAIRGKTVDWRQITTLNSAKFKLEGASQGTEDDGYTAQSTPVKYCYANGQVTGPMQAAGAAFINMLRQEVMTHTRSLVYAIEEAIITGDASTNAEEFSGFDTLITTNTTDKSSAEFDLDDV